MLLDIENLLYFTNNGNPKFATYLRKKVLGRTKVNIPVVNIGLARYQDATPPVRPAFLIETGLIRAEISEKYSCVFTSTISILFVG